MKKVIQRVIILALVFIATVTAVLFFRQEKETTPTYSSMAEASLPVVHLKYGENWLSALHGHTYQMDAAYMREDLTPLEDSRVLPLKIVTYGTNVTSLSYEVRSIKENRLLESQEVTGFDASQSEIIADITLTDLMDLGEEYILVVKLATEDYPEVNYYSRICYASDTMIGQTAAQSLDFSAKTFDKSLAEELTSYMETDNSVDNSSLGYVNIHSSFNQLTWGDLAPVRQSEPSIRMLEMQDSVTSLILTYQVSATVDDVEENYRVSEYFNWKYSGTDYYLLAYERNMQQVFTINEKTVSDGVVQLGIISDNNLPVYLYQNEELTNLTVFSYDGSLYAYDSTKNEMILLYNFSQEGDDGVRTDYDQHGFQVSGIDGDGNISFLVYGYMNRGSYEGQTGILFYEYNRKDNNLVEKLYIPYDRPYQVLKEDVSSLAYVSDTGMLYLMLQNNLYAIDSEGKEQIDIALDLQEDCYAINENKNVIAWQEGGLYDNKTIKLMRLDTSETYTFTAEEGEVIQVLGFLRDDLIYGVARESDLVTDQSLTTIFPMYKLLILNKSGEEVNKYQKEGYYIKSITIKNNSIQLERLGRNEDGSFAAAASDAILPRAEDDSSTVNVLKSDTSEVKKICYWLNLTSSDTDSAEYKNIIPQLQEAGSETVISIAMNAAKDEQYYAYAGGRIRGIYRSMSKAISAVYEEMGVVVNARQSVLYVRGTRDVWRNIQLSSPSLAASTEESLVACLDSILAYENVQANAAEELEAGKSAFDVLDDHLTGTVLDLSGCSLDQILYYVNERNPVLVLTENNSAQLIIGFDATSITLYNPLNEGTTTNMSKDDAENVFSQYGNVFMSYID